MNDKNSHKSFSLSATTRLVSILCLCLFCAGASACTEDSAPAYDYNAVTGAGGIAGTVGASGAGGLGGVAGAAAGSAGVGSAAGTGGGSGSGGVAAVGGGSGTGVTAGTGSVAGSGGVAGVGEPSGKCDLSGRWLETLHTVTSAIGQQQTAHSFIYYEIGPGEAGGFKIVKGLYCGNDAVSEGAFAVQVSFEGSRDANREHISFMGRTISSTATGSGCDVHFSKLYTVRGATLPFYLDPNNPLPNAMQQANGSTPGWEDWDGDSNPGITGTLTGTVNGRIFTAPRIWDEPHGTVPDVMTTFTVPVTWDQEQNVMSYDPATNFTLGSASERAGDPALHFADFARLSAEQTAGDDKTLCDSVVQLAPTLTPHAAGI